jgi:hypothetical protein
MAFKHGRSAVTKIDNAAGTLTDISSIVNNTEYPRSVQAAETTSYGSLGKTYISGLEDATVSISGTWDNVIDATFAAMMDAVTAGTLASVTLEHGPAGSGTGMPKYTLEFIPTSYSVSTPVGGVITFKIDGQRTGLTTRTTY